MTERDLRVGRRIRLPDIRRRQTDNMATGEMAPAHVAGHLQKHADLGVVGAEIARQIHAAH